MKNKCSIDCDNEKPQTEAVPAELFTSMTTLFIRDFETSQTAKNIVIVTKYK